MNRKTFKCVMKTEYNKKYLSFIASVRICDDQFSLKYQIGKVTTPKIGKIFVFDTLENAEAFRNINYYYDTVILSGIATNVGKPKYISMVRYIKTFWEFKRKKKKIVYGTFAKTCPKGTLTCDSFTPEKIVG